MNENNEKTPQERLEIREFILDSNLFLITMSFHILNMIACFLYYEIGTLYFSGDTKLPVFVISTSLFIFMIIFSIHGYRGVKSQKKYISRLDSVFEDSFMEEITNITTTGDKDAK